MGGIVGGISNEIFGGPEGQQQAYAAADQYRGLKQPLYDNFMSVTGAMKDRATMTDNPYQKLIDQYMSNQFDKANSSITAHSASNTLRNQSAVQRQDAFSRAAMGAEMGSQAAKMKFDDMSHSMSDVANLYNSRLGSLEGATEQARGTGAKTGQGADETSRANTQMLGSAMSGGMSPLFGGGGSGAAGAGGGAGAGGMMAMLSDETKKRDIKDGSSKIEAFLDAVSNPKKYKYKESAKESGLAKDGEMVSPMAQDLEKSNLGEQMVKDSKDGKVVDMGAGFGAMLAGLGDIHSRLKKLEKKGK